jgi:hypothetical protein
MFEFQCMCAMPRISDARVTTAGIAFVAARGHRPAVAFNVGRRMDRAAAMESGLPKSTSRYLT